MCGICGCVETQNHKHPHDYPHPHRHSHSSSTEQKSDVADCSTANPAQARLIQIEQDVYAANNFHAKNNRLRLQQKRMLALNLVSSPGSGKTTLLVKLIEQLQKILPVLVIEGDQQTDMDARRIRTTGVPTTQINTGKGCHLDAHMIGHALEDLPPFTDGVLFIENVGNLVCPAGFDLGEAHKIVVLSVTEGEDKPLKYPDIFAAADLMVINKSDLLPYLDVSVDVCIKNARRVNPGINIFTVSARTGEGIPALCAWIETRITSTQRANITTS